MKSKYIKTAAIVGSVLALGSACKKKSKGSSASPSATGTTTETTALSPDEQTAVSIATGQLQLATSVTILPAKGADAALTLNGRKAYALTVEGRTLNLRVSNEAFSTI